MDVMTDLLERSRAHGAAFAQTTASGDWAMRFGGGTGLAVHVVVEGEVRLWTDERRAGPVRDTDGTGGEELHLLAGDLVLVRGDLEHCMGRRRTEPRVTIEQLVAGGPVPGSARHYRLGTPDGPPDTRFFCGAYQFEGDLCAGLLRALPDTVRMRPAAGSTLHASLELLARELERDDPGQQALLDRLLDVALIQVLRDHLGDRPDDAPAWFRAEADPPVAQALRAMHADPAHAWTVDELAEEAALSRSAFARRFAAALGEAPMAYLTGWRMALARELLRDTDGGLAAVAAAVGYRSEFAFAAAFKRHHGVAPGRWRTSIATGDSAHERVAALR